MSGEDEDEDINTDDLEEEEGGEGKGIGGKKIILIVVALVVLIGGAIGGYFFFAGSDSGGGEEMAAEEAATGSEGGSGTLDTQFVYYDLPEFLVNLNTPGKKTSFLKMKVTLELAGGEQVTEKVMAIEPKIQDTFNTYLRELRASDLKGSAGIYRLREELLVRVNRVTAPMKVNDILFKEMIVQ